MFLEDAQMLPGHAQMFLGHAQIFLEHSQMILEHAQMFLRQAHMFLRHAQALDEAFLCMSYIEITQNDTRGSTLGFTNTVLEPRPV